MIDKMSDSQAEPHLFVIFGATGDLACRKLIPAFYELQNREGFGGRSVVLGVGRSPMTDDEYRAQASEALIAAGLDPNDAEKWCGAVPALSEHRGGFRRRWLSGSDQSKTNTRSPLRTGLSIWHCRPRCSNRRSRDWLTPG